MTREYSRRTFLAVTGASGTALTRPFARVLGANDDIRIAVVGIGSSIKVGGKGKQDIRDWLKTPGVRVAALCDVDRAHLDPEVQKLRDQNINVEAYTDVRRLLEDKNIDAVSITTPNHWHALVAVWACQAGKDVFVQKPASHTIFEGRKMIEAARKYHRIVLATAGPRGRTGMREAFEFARGGGLGKMLVVHGICYRPRTSIGKVAQPIPIPKSLDYDLWSGPAPIMPVMREFLHYDWHWNWLYGNGEIGNTGPHNMDGCRMALDRNSLPERVMSIGGRFGYADDGQTPNTQIALYDYRPAPIIFEVRGLPKDKSFLAADWEKGARKTMDAYLGLQQGTFVHCEDGYIAGNKAYDKTGKLIREFEPTNTDQNQNFVTAVRSRKTSDLTSDIVQGHLSAALCHLGNISHRIGRETAPEEIRAGISGAKDFTESYERLLTHLEANGIDLKTTRLTLGAQLQINPADETFVGPFAARANELRTREYRAPFIVPERV